MVRLYSGLGFLGAVMAGSWDLSKEWEEITTWHKHRGRRNLINFNLTMKFGPKGMLSYFFRVIVPLAVVIIVP